MAAQGARENDHEAPEQESEGPGHDRQQPHADRPTSELPCTHARDDTICAADRIMADRTDGSWLDALRGALRLRSLRRWCGLGHQADRRCNGPACGDFEVLER